MWKKGLSILLTCLFVLVLAVSFSLPSDAASENGLQYFSVNLSGGKNVPFSSVASGSLLDRVVNGSSYSLSGLTVGESYTLYLCYISSGLDFFDLPDGVTMLALDPRCNVVVVGSKGSAEPIASLYGAVTGSSVSFVADASSVTLYFSYGFTPQARFSGSSASGTFSYSFFVDFDGYNVSASLYPSVELQESAGSLIDFALTSGTAILDFAVNDPLVAILLVMFIAGFSVVLLARVIGSL